MAVTSSAPMKLEFPSKTVQELIKTTDKQVPEKYVFHHQNKPADDPSELKYMDSSVIDFSLLFSPSLKQQEQELQKLRSVLSSWGCVQIINHGISSSLQNEICQVVKEFFALPIEVKQKCRTPDWLEGFGSDAVPENQSYNWSDRIRLKVYPFDQRTLEIWPESLPNFRTTLEEYTTEVIKLQEMLLKAIAKSLNLEENSFVNACGADRSVNMHTRINYYPPCSTPEKVLGLRPHSDGSTITILLQDNEVEGLQVEKNNKWFKVPTVPGSLYINIGDQMEMMSNGIFKSAVHKVVVDKERERTSVVMVCFPDPEEEIGPLSELIDEERPQLYKKVRNYFDAFTQCYVKGKRGIHSVKI